MANGTKLHSSGYVMLNVRFSGEYEPYTTIIARVVKRFPFDLLLGHSFLETTGTLKKHLRRFTKIRFSRLMASSSMNFLASDTSRSYFKASFNDGIPFDAMLDTGSNCNAVDLDWARGKNLQLYQEDEHCGWISLPSGWVRTVGRVYVDMNLTDDKKIQMAFEVLENAVVPVLIGVGAIFDHRLLTEYPEALLEKYEDESGLLHMNYKSQWVHSVVEKAKKLFRSNAKVSGVAPIPREDEDIRSSAWDIKYDYGRTASAEEWRQEYSRRYRHMMAMSDDRSSALPLILFAPLEAT